MFRACRTCFVNLSLVTLIFAIPGPAQAPDDATATLREVHVDGLKMLVETQVITLSGLEAGTQIGRKDLQSGADRLIQSGLFAKVKYTFKTRGDGVVLTFHVEEAPRIPAYFDNFPWFADSELRDAIRKKLVFFDGTLPEAGSVVDQAGEVLNDLLVSRGLRAALTHTVIANPLGEGNVQEFRIEGATLQIAKLEFSDPALAALRVVKQHLTEILGKAYSRMTIDLFLWEQIRPVYLQQGYLRAKLGPPEVRLSGDPNQKLPEQIPVFVPVASGAVYHWKDMQWSGNTVLSEFTLNKLLGAKPGDLADGMETEAGWDRVREEYAHRGYLEAKLDLVPSYDDVAHTISYVVAIQEGPQYRFGRMILSGLSLAGERKLHAAWPIASGDIFDKTKFEETLANLQMHAGQIFGELPVHYESVGHWLQTDAANGTVDVLLDFK
jgi:outer membrane protein insertion porin family